MQARKENISSKRAWASGWVQLEGSVHMVWHGEKCENGLTFFKNHFVTREGGSKARQQPGNNFCLQNIFLADTKLRKTCGLSAAHVGSCQIQVHTYLNTTIIYIWNPTLSFQWFVYKIVILAVASSACQFWQHFPNHERDLKVPHIFHAPQLAHSLKSAHPASCTIQLNAWPSYLCSVTLQLSISY